MEQSYEDLFNQMYGGNKPEPDKEPEVEEDQEQEEEQEQEQKEQEQEEKPEPEAKEDEDDYSRLIDDISDPELKKKIQHLAQSERSQRGRVSALTKKAQKLEEMYNNALRYKEEEAQAKPQPKSESQDSASTAEEKGREEEPTLPPEVVAIKDKHPAVYAAFKKLSEMESTRAIEQAKADILKELDTRIKPVEATYEKEAMNKEARRFENMASELLDTENTNVTIRDVISSQEFAKWIRGQSPRIQNFYKNAADADDGILVLTKFVNDTSYLKGLEKQLKDSPQETPETSKGDELKEKRQARKKASVGTKPSSAVTSGDGSGDYESIFNSFWGENGAYRTRRKTG